MEHSPEVSHIPPGTLRMCIEHYGMETIKFVMYVCPNHPHGTTQLPPDIFFLMFFQKSVKNTRFPLNSNKNARYFTWSSTYIYDRISLNLLEWEMFQTKVAEKIETHILCLIPFLWKLCHLWHNTEKYGIPRKAMGDNIMQHMCFACQITDARIQTYTQNM